MPSRLSFGMSPKHQPGFFRGLKIRSRGALLNAFGGYIIGMEKVFCRTCSIVAFKTWQGWPVDLPSHLGSFKKPPPLPRLDSSGACPRCGARTVLAASHIRYSSYGVGLPTFDLVICDPDKNPEYYAALSEWGKPYAATLPMPVEKRSSDYRRRRRTLRVVRGGKH
jgi:hypothetical protein